MFYVVGALIFSAIGISIEGFSELTIPQIGILISLPIMAVYRMLGNRPAFFLIFGWLASVAAGIILIGAYIVIPLQYYFEIWGWGGVVGGIVATILLPAQFFLFLLTTYFKGGAGTYVIRFIAGLCFAASGAFLCAGFFAGQNQTEKE